MTRMRSLLALVVTGFWLLCFPGPGLAASHSINGNTLTSPDDYAVTVYADYDQVVHPTGLVSVEHEGSRITYVGSLDTNTPVRALVDTDMDGTVDQVVNIFSTTPSESHSVVVDPVTGHLYIGVVDAIYVCLAANEFAGKLGAEGDPDCMLFTPLPLHNVDATHGRTSLAFDQAGDRLCYGAGADCDVCQTNEDLFGCLFCFDMNEVRLALNDEPANVLPLTGTDGVPAHAARVAQGVRYSGGMAFHPKTDELWFTELNVAGVSGDAWRTYEPDAELNVVENGDNDPHFGFPYQHRSGSYQASEAEGCVTDDELISGFYRDCHDDAFLRAPGPGQGPINDSVYYTDRPAGIEFKIPQQALGPHFHPLGLAFYDRDRLIEENCAAGRKPNLFPQSFNEQGIIANWGSWDNFGLVSGYKLTTFKVGAENTITTYENFLQGFRQEGNVNNPNPGILAWTRPYGLEVLDDGSLLVSTNDVWGVNSSYVLRVQYTGADAATYSCPPRPDRVFDDGFE